MNFVEEIDYNEIKLLEVVGKGSFGVVNKAKWREKIVAVKMINSELERKAFLVELRQLSRVDHPNIVKLHGACQTKPVCLVMEYAEGGSLYNVLHGNPQPEYTAAHAISWALQCSRGVAYLHGMKPKALIHRDLKPPNLLLIMGGTVLKICDFGTACDIQTHMTNNKGSAAWMAPEVFEGSKYSETCDVFSWGIILWEVISRHKPFDDIRGSAYQILWAVHSGKRPPLIKRCPKPLEILMKRCWAKEPNLRPSMDEVVNIMTHLFVFFKGAEQPIKYPEETDGLSEENSDDSGDSYDSREVTCGSDNTSQLVAETSSSDHSTQKDAGSFAESVDTLSSNLTPMANNYRVSITSAPASIVGSLENIHSQSEKTLESEYNILNSFNHLKASTPEPSSKASHGHKRSGSYGSNFVVPAQIPETSITRVEARRKSEDVGNNMQSSLLNQVLIKEDKASSPSWHRETPTPSTTSAQSPAFTYSIPKIKPLEPSRDTIDNAYCLLEPHLQPIVPQQNSKESMRIFEEHKKRAYNLFSSKSDLELLKQRKSELITLLSGPHSRNATDIVNEFDNLLLEKESLQKLYENLEQQLAITRKQLHP